MSTCKTPFLKPQHMQMYVSDGFPSAALCMSSENCGLEVHYLHFRQCLQCLSAKAHNMAGACKLWLFWGSCVWQETTIMWCAVIISIISCTAQTYTWKYSLAGPNRNTDFKICKEAHVYEDKHAELFDMWYVIKACCTPHGFMFISGFSHMFSFIAWWNMHKHTHW